LFAPILPQITKNEEVEKVVKVEKPNVVAKPEPKFDLDKYRTTRKTQSRKHGKPAKVPTTKHNVSVMIEQQAVEQFKQRAKDALLPPKSTINSELIEKLANEAKENMNLPIRKGCHVYNARETFGGRFAARVYWDACPDKNTLNANNSHKTIQDFETFIAVCRFFNKWYKTTLCTTVNCNRGFDCQWIHWLPNHLLEFAKMDMSFFQEVNAQMTIRQSQLIYEPKELVSLNPEMHLFSKSYARVIYCEADHETQSDFDECERKYHSTHNLNVFLAVCRSFNPHYKIGACKTINCREGSNCPYHHLDKLDCDEEFRMIDKMILSVVPATPEQLAQELNLFNTEFSVADWKCDPRIPIWEAPRTKWEKETHYTNQYYNGYRDQMLAYRDLNHGMTLSQHRVFNRFIHRLWMKCSVFPKNREQIAIILCRSCNLKIKELERAVSYVLHGDDIPDSPEVLEQEYIPEEDNDEHDYLEETDAFGNWIVKRIKRANRRLAKHTKQDFEALEELNVDVPDTEDKDEYYRQLGRRISRVYSYHAAAPNQWW
jgi:uncharacterized protein (DUF4415 family)